MLARIRRAAREHDEGFTLIELLVVIIIIGILAAIAIPVYLQQRNKGYDAAAKADLKAVALQQEAWLTAHDIYADSVGNATLTEFKPTAGVQTVVNGVGGDGFCAVARSRSGDVFWYDSSAGGLSGPSDTPPSGGICAEDGNAPDVPAP
jgi:type IV pilus assembly protein PilA